MSSMLNASESSDMKRDKHNDFLQKVMATPNEWVHLPRIKRKNNLHNKSDERNRKKIFAITCQSLRLMGIKFNVRETYFIRLE